MSTERIEQCKRDIALLQAELALLEAEAKPKPKHGDIVLNRSGTVGADRRIILSTPQGFIASTENSITVCGINGSTVEREYACGYYRCIGNVFTSEIR